MRCETTVNKNLIAESGCNKHYLVAENECTSRAIRSFLMTEKIIEKIENYRQVYNVSRGNVARKIEPMSNIGTYLGLGNSFSLDFTYLLQDISTILVEWVELRPRLRDFPDSNPRSDTGNHDRSFLRFCSGVPDKERCNASNFLLYFFK